MAKWIYERWQPKWPDTSGPSYTFKDVSVSALSYDGTLQDPEIDFSAVVSGHVFYLSAVGPLPGGYYQKVDSDQAIYLGTDPPLPIKDTLIDAMAAEEGTYPDDGIHTDGYWYVKVKPAVKWIYERYPARWDATAFTSSINSTFIYSYTINIGTLEVEEREQSVGEAALATSRIVSNYNAGEAVSVRLYQGQSGKNHLYKRSSYTRDELSTHRIKGDRMPDIILEEGTVPDDGIHTDGYWYVKVKPAFPTMRILRNGQWIEAESGFVLKDGVWKPIEDVFVLKNGQWKNLQ